MGKAMFYHLTRRPMEDTLTMLLGKARQAGWRVLVRGTDSDRLTWLDGKLWLEPEDGFLPHGLAGGEHDAAQPILLSKSDDIANAAQCVMSIDGAEITPKEVENLDRCCVLFDGNAPEALQVARNQWRTLKEAGVVAEYWSEDSGAWELKAQT
ncbi:MAG: DNA polymerase III subunit chi [Roseobacter sp.]